MSGLKTPRENLSEEIDEIEEIFQDTPVEMNLKAGSSTKRERATILDFLLKWIGIQWINSKFLRMSPGLNSEQQWRKWFRGFFWIFRITSLRGRIPQSWKISMSYGDSGS